jgi:hypothetical protein
MSQAAERRTGLDASAASRSAADSAGDSPDRRRSGLALVMIHLVSLFRSHQRLHRSRETAIRQWVWLVFACVFFVSFGFRHQNGKYALPPAGRALFVAIAVAFGLLLYLRFVRGSLRVTDRGLGLVNPLHTVHIPWRKFDSLRIKAFGAGAADRILRDEDDGVRVEPLKGAGSWEGRPRMIELAVAQKGLLAMAGVEKRAFADIHKRYHKAGRMIKVRAGRSNAVAVTVFVLALGLIACTPTRAATLVTLGFDDDSSNQMTAASVLGAAHVRATFYVNTGTIDTPGRLTWAQIHQLAAAGNEIGGHGRRHIDLTTLSGDALKANVCEDRDALVAQGLPALSFAYPNGHWSPEARDVVRTCGYVTARSLGGLAPSELCPSSLACPTAEPLPLSDPLATRTSPPVTAHTGVEGLKSAVLHAEEEGGWLQFVFHRVDEDNSSSVSSKTLAAFARWLQPRAVLDTRVVTAAEAVATASAPAKPILAPRTRVLSLRRVIDPARSRVGVRCAGACVVEVSVTPISSAAKMLQLRPGVPVARGIGQRRRAGVVIVPIVVRPSVLPRWSTAFAPVSVGLRVLITLLTPPARAAPLHSSR